MEKTNNSIPATRDPADRLGNLGMNAQEMAGLLGIRTA